MKRIIALLLALMMCLTLCACGGGNDEPNTPDASEETNETADNAPKATVITNEGETVEMSAEELIAAYDSNQAKFNKLYLGAQITFTGTVSYIKVNTGVAVEEGKVSAGQNKVVFEEGWCLVVGAENSAIDLADYDVGEVLEVTTSIVGAPFDTDFLKATSDNIRVLWLVGNDNIHDIQYSDVETTISKVN